ncbi:MAG: tRNA (guanosine(37)-N1)-methyltransferase TrmD [Desulfobulbus propionicus]|nr:MAG: tRNA (guanosine(37)-N1)-methyltransferase TrmD [Desulfobulbus propionicus]
MIFEIATIFPDFFSSPLQEGIIRRAIAAGKIQVRIHNIRDWATDKHQMTDDRPFGGGEGMVMKPEPLAACLAAIPKTTSQSKVILLSPRGRLFSHPAAVRLAGMEQILFICGRYEGVDQRFCNAYVDEEYSIGDFILSGGELGAMVMLDAITRLIPGVLGCSGSAANDTFSRNLLKHHQYTRPRSFAGMEVPSELLTGNHAGIAEYRFLESVSLTLERRPDLLTGARFSGQEVQLLKEKGMWRRIAGLLKQHGGSC